MAGLTQALQQQVLDSTILFPTTAAVDHIAYSANGTTETTALTRTPIGATGWAAATAATPSVKSASATPSSGRSGPASRPSTDPEPPTVRR
jgi:hypothetical protein